jgi:mono/diheme cytochrome c family protein
MRVRGVLLATAVLLLTGTLFLQARGQSSGTTPQSPSANTSGSAKAGAAQANASLALGKKVFMERCASCHNADGSAELPDGVPLNKRSLSEEKLRKNVNGRLKDRSEEERRGVFDYIQSFRRS